MVTREGIWRSLGWILEARGWIRKKETENTEDVWKVMDLYGWVRKGGIWELML